MTEQEVTPARIIQIGTGGWGAAILATSAIHSIFTHIEKDADTVDAVAKKASISPRGAGALLDGLVGLGFLTVSEGRYRNEPDAAEFLVEGKPTYFGGFPKFLYQTYSDWLDLAEITKTGRTKHAEGEVPDNPFWEQLVLAIFVLSVPVVQTAAERLKIAQAGPISILDVGGGSAVYSVLWLGMNPKARSTQIDWGNINRIAHEYVGRAGAADRFRTIDGDFHTTDFGNAEHDIGVYSHIAHQESPSSNIAIFKKFRKALKPGGTLLISDFVVENDRSGPPFALLFRSEMLVHMKEGSTWRRADYEKWLKEAGFQKVDFAPTPSPATLVYAS